MSESRIIVALDYPDRVLALQFVEQVTPELCRLKIGKEMFTRFGPAFVTEMINKGFDVFLDLKFHDIPNTVAQACAVAADLGVWMVNVHASGGSRMMSAAREKIDTMGGGPLLIGVTVLTSMDEAGLRELGVDASPAEQVVRLAKLASDSGLDGVVCSPMEAAGLRQTLADDFLLVTPGVRPAGDSVDDQKRIATPATAIQDGANYLVIGRPITQADDPYQKLLTIRSEISQ